MTNEEIVQEILFEAGKHGLLYEVIEEAKRIMESNKGIDRTLAYQMALEEWVK